MKKTIKTAMFAVAVVAAGFGGLKAYNAYQLSKMSDSEFLLSENIEALSQSPEDMTNYVEVEMMSVKDEEGGCWGYVQTGASYYDDYGNLHIQFAEVKVDSWWTCKDVPKPLYIEYPWQCQEKKCSNGLRQPQGHQPCLPFYN